MQKLFIANRGEIAIRIIKTCRSIGVKTVLGVSEADETSLAAKWADEVAALGGAAAQDSYLRIDAVLDAAKQFGCDAVHPGYGFLSERPEFSEACTAAGITFVGPSPNSMRMLGSKIEAKMLASEAGVPLVPGYFKPDATDDELFKGAEEVGYPILLKASAGGGGRGMRAVNDPSEFAQALLLAKEESLKAFGDSRMMVERNVQDPRHIEVQFLADRFGTVACLFERECSLQRRHQKVVEEAPSPYPRIQELWPGMVAAVKQLVQSCSYVGAGTAEFLVDSVRNEFYFLEVNARLQVEHPITELITGLDLVRCQLAIAEGASLSEIGVNADLMRDQIHGHAFELRIIAENPAKGFLPSIGKILGWSEPKGPGIRVDSGFETESEVTQYYDSLLAKLIVFGADREEARLRCLAALEDFHILGVTTNISYLKTVLSDEGVKAGVLSTHLLESTFADWSAETLPSDDPVLAALKAYGQQLSARGSGQGVRGKPRLEIWQSGGNFRNV